MPRLGPAEAEIRQFDVSEPRLHSKGKYTLYKVTHRRYPKQNPDAGVEVVVWRRFNDFKRLYRELYRLHEALCRPAAFPDSFRALFKVKVFGRFDAVVIEERRLAALELLQFVATQPHLYESDGLATFLQGSELVVRQDDLKSIADAPLIPSPDDVVSSNADEDSSISERKQRLSMRNDVVVGDAAPLDDARQSSDTSSFYLDGVSAFERIRTKVTRREYFLAENGPGESTAKTSAGVASSNLAIPSSDCPVRAVGLPIAALSSAAATSSGDLARSLSHDDVTAAFSSIPTQFDSSYSSMSLPRLSSNVTTSNGSSAFPEPELGGTWQHPCEGSLDDLYSYSSTSLNHDLGVDAASIASEDADSCPNVDDYGAEKLKYFDNQGRQPPGKNEGRLGRKTTDLSVATQSASRPSRDEALLNWDVRVGGPEGASYIVSAANQITKAQDHESTESYQEAFDCYRTAVGILLSGVQSDTNCARRDAVRRKTAQYLTRAEDIYRLFLGDDTHEPDRWAKTTTTTAFASISSEERSTDDFVGCSSTTPPSDRRGDAEELKQFQVVGVFDSAVLLVRPAMKGRNRMDDLDPDGCYALKVLRKRNVDDSSSDSRPPPLLPRDVSFVAQMIRYYEMPHAYYFLVEVAAGGRLFDYLTPFFESTPSGSIGDLVDGAMIRGGDRRGGDASHSEFTTPTSLRRWAPRSVLMKDDHSDEDFGKVNAYSGHNLLRIQDSSAVTKSMITDPSSDQTSFSKSVDSRDPVASFASFDTDRRRSSSDGLSNDPTTLPFPHDSRSICTHREDSAPESVDGCREVSASKSLPSIRGYAQSRQSHPGDYILAGGGDVRLQRNIGQKHISSFDCREKLEEVVDEKSESVDEDTSSGDDFLPGRVPPEGASNHRTSGDGGGTSGVNVSDPNPPEKEHSYSGEKELADEFSLDPGLFVKACGKRRHDRLSPCLNEACLRAKGGLAYPLPDNPCDSSLVSSSVPDTPEEPYSPTTDDDFRPAQFSSQQRSHHRQHPLRLPPPDRRCSRASAAYTPSSLESTEIICTSSTSHTYEDLLPRGGEPINSKNVLFPVTPCNCHSCQVARSAKGSIARDDDYQPCFKDDRLYVNEDRGKFSATQCGCEACVAGLPYESGETDPTASLVTQNYAVFPSISASATLPRSDSQIPDYFEGDPSVMVHSKSDHSIKIQMTGDTMQVEITSVEDDGARNGDSTNDDNDGGNLSADFDALFKEMEDANGELTRIPEACVRNWGAEILVALDQLHRLGIEWRDFNPRNILMDEKGHVLLTYLGLLPCRGNSNDERARDLLYAAPEVNDVAVKGAVPFACDWWSVGAILYEMLVGVSLHQSFPYGFHAHTQIVNFPDHVSTEARGLLRDLLKYHPHCRLGAGHGRFEEIKSHPFFEGIQWPN